MPQYCHKMMSKAPRFACINGRAALCWSRFVPPLSGRVRVATRNSRQDQPLTINLRLDGLGEYTFAPLSQRLAPIAPRANEQGRVVANRAPDRMVRVLES
jgi:hypothetical protein